MRPFSNRNSKFLKQTLAANSAFQYDPEIAGSALIDGLKYFKKRMEWSGARIAHVLHLSPNTLNTWLQKKVIRLGRTLSPDIQAVIHLLGIHRDLELMFENASHQRAWLETFHPELNSIPEELMAKSFDGLIYVHRYLEYVRGFGA